MRRDIRDKIAAFIVTRGPDGITASELAHAFLHPASASPELCARLIRQILAGDPRVHERKNGKWAGVATHVVPSEYVTGYCVIEVSEATTATGRTLIEWAGDRVDDSGRIGETASGIIRPEPWPKGLVTPEHLRGKLTGGAPLAEAVRDASQFAGGATIVALRPGTFHTALIESASAADGALLCLLKLAHQTLGAKARHVDTLAAVLGVPVREPATAADRAAYTAELLAAMLGAREALGLGEPEDWLDRQAPAPTPVDFSSFDFTREDVANLPEAPGIYIMRDANDRVLYVGKAANLRARVGSYFRSRIRRDEKTDRILESVCSLTIESKGSEIEALLAEYRAIRELQPAINVQFDVHKRPAATRAERDLILVLPSVDEGCAEILLLHRNRALRQVRVARDLNHADPMEPASALDKGEAIIKAFFFSAQAPESIAPEASAIAWTWLRKHEDEVNLIDVGIAGGLDATMELLRRYLGEPPGNGRVIHI